LKIKRLCKDPYLWSYRGIMKISQYKTMSVCEKKRIMYVLCQELILKETHHIVW
jgi:hypothetical protein